VPNATSISAFFDNGESRTTTLGNFSESLRASTNVMLNVIGVGQRHSTVRSVSSQGVHRLIPNMADCSPVDAIGVLALGLSTICGMVLS